MAAATHILKIVIQVTGNGKKAMDTVGKGVDDVGKKLKRTNKIAGTFDMRLLSLMFGGMALQRAFGRVLKSVVNTFLKAEDHTSGLAKATVRLSASWEFLKFSIMDALNTDWFIGMIDGLVKFINWLSQLDGKWKVAFLSVSGGLFIIGGMMMVIGQFKLGWDAIMGTSGLLASVGRVVGLGGLGSILVIFALIAVVVIAFKQDFEGMGDIAETVWDGMKGPLGNIRDQFDKLADTVGLQDSWKALGVAGVGVFTVLSGAVMNTAFAVELLITQTVNLVKALAALAVGDYLEVGKIGVQSIKDTVDWTDRWTKANQELFEDADASMKKIMAAGTNTIFGGGQTGGGVGYTGSYGVEGEDPFARIDRIREGLDGVVTSTSDLDDSSKDLSKSYNEKLLPSFQGIIDIVGGKEGIIDQLKFQGTEMDIVAGEKTTTTKAASVERVEQFKEEKQAIKEMAEEYQSYLSTGRVSNLDVLTGSSPVSDED